MSLEEGAMLFRAAIGFICIFLTGLSGAAIAQSTVVVVVPQTIPDGLTRPVPRQLDILDTDYPLESLLANEEGQVSLNLLVDAEGKVTFAQVLTGSGSQRLDQAAVRVARTRWQFQAAVKDGQPAVGSARVDVTWKPPLRPAYEYQMDVSLLPRDGPVTFKPAVPVSRGVTADDYPRPAIRTRQEGMVVVKFVILETGGVGDIAVVETSGRPILDRAAVEMVRRRWRYEPATLNGTPIPVPTHAHILFQLTAGRALARRCFPEPLLGSNMVMTPQGGTESVRVSQWVHLTADGTVDDILVRTQGGWMHFAPSAVQEISQLAKYPPASRERRPDSCWFDSTVVVGPGQK
jgi:TonB family protein